MDRSADWLKQAERDIEVATRNATEGYHEWAAFAAQQGAEKAAKALAESHHGAVRGHSISGILVALGDAARAPANVLDAARELDQVYVTARYPNGFVSGAPSDYFTKATSQRLLHHARTVFEFCRSQVSGPGSRP